MLWAAMFWRCILSTSTCSNYSGYILLRALTVRILWFQRDLYCFTCRLDPMASSTSGSLQASLLGSRSHVQSSVYVASSLASVDMLLHLTSAQSVIFNFFMTLLLATLCSINCIQRHTSTLGADDSVPYILLMVPAGVFSMDLLYPVTTSRRISILWSSSFLSNCASLVCVVLTGLRSSISLSLTQRSVMCAESLKAHATISCIVREDMVPYEDDGPMSGSCKLWRRRPYLQI